MGNEIERFIINLATMRFTRKELLNIIDWLDTISPYELCEVIDIINKDIKLRLYDNIFTITKLNYDNHIKSSITYQNKFPDDIAKRVDNLLRREAGLTAHDAARYLLEILSDEPLPNNVKNIPALGKKSFNLWINQLAHIFPGSKLLQAATTIRNYFVDSKSNSAWPLK